MTIETAAASFVPAFIKVADVALAIGVTRECIFDRVRRGKMPAYEVASAHTKGWSRTTLLKRHPDLAQVMIDYFSDKKAPN